MVRQLAVAYSSCLIRCLLKSVVAIAVTAGDGREFDRTIGTLIFSLRVGCMNSMRGLVVIQEDSARTTGIKIN